MRRRQFKVRTLLILPIIIAVLLFALDSFQRTHWAGHTTVQLDFRVLDGSSETAIPGATVELGSEDPRETTYNGKTDPDGRVSLNPIVFAFGTRSLLRRSRQIEYFYSIRINAQGYQAIEMPLEQLTGQPEYHSDAHPPEIVLRLRKE